MTALPDADASTTLMAAFPSSSTWPANLLSTCTMSVHWKQISTSFRRNAAVIGAAGFLGMSMVWVSRVDCNNVNYLQIMPAKEAQEKSLHSGGRHASSMVFNNIVVGDDPSSAHASFTVMRTVDDTPFDSHCNSAPTMAVVHGRTRRRTRWSGHKGCLRQRNRDGSILPLELAVKVAVVEAISPQISKRDELPKGRLLSLLFSRL